jgi:hypothetical protein
MTEIEDDEAKGPFDRLTRSTALVVLLCSSPVYFIFSAMGDPAKGRAAFIMTGMIIFAVILCWELRRHIWFWTTLVLLIVLHWPLLQFVPWSNKNYPGVALLPHALIDFAVVYGCIKLVELLVKESSDSKPRG